MLEDRDGALGGTPRMRAAIRHQLRTDCTAIHCWIFLVGLSKIGLVLIWFTRITVVSVLTSSTGRSQDTKGSFWLVETQRPFGNKHDGLSARKE